MFSRLVGYRSTRKREKKDMMKRHSETVNGIEKTAEPFCENESLFNFAKKVNLDKVLCNRFV